jgi:hypothetical protein
MGLAIDRERFEPEDYAKFEHRLARSLAVLEDLLARPGFGEGEPSLGAELEVALIDDACRPLPLNLEVIRETLDERMTVELNRFNVECNLRHTELRGKPFSHLRRELESARNELRRAAGVHGGRVAMIGILPTLSEADLGHDAMTNFARFLALSRSLRTAREGPFRLDIDGQDPLQLDCDDVTYEGAATSLQIHLRVAPGDFAQVFNACQLATAPVLAASGNSPVFLSHLLWEETRVALFKQAVDDRGEAERDARQPARVAFGSGWLQDGASALFREAVESYSVLLPVLGAEDPDECIASGGTPRLEEIRLHQGTVWHWNRPVYDPHDGGHVRIELRALPAGPTIEDMLANSAFLIGATLGIADRLDAVAPDLDFELASYNFYRSAQQGLDAMLIWPASLGGGSRPMRAGDVIELLGDLARAGLAGAGVAAADYDALIGAFLERAERGQTGARWQRAVLRSLEAKTNRAEALAAMLNRYLEHSADGQPVHSWPVP